LRVSGTARERLWVSSKTGDSLISVIQFPTFDLRHLFVTTRSYGTGSLKLLCCSLQWQRWHPDGTRPTVIVHIHGSDHSIIFIIIPLRSSIDRRNMWSLAYVMMLCVLLTKGRFTEAAAFVRQYPTKATTTRGFPHHRRRRATTTTDPIIHCCPYRSSSSSSSSLWLSSDYSTTDYDNFVVGYGSIMCNVSRSITCPDLVSAPAIPVLVRNTERT